MDARPIFEHVAGWPFQPGARVRVVRAVDPEVYDVARLIGEVGTVEYLEYDCGCSERFPHDPMVGVLLDGVGIEEFWREELEALSS